MNRATLIISFYNRIDYLKLIFTALERQVMKDFEIIVADDGSNQTIIGQLEELFLTSSYKVTHLWHPDKGFRKNKILNMAITAAGSDYLIFIDGDCIPHPEFINEHVLSKEETFCITGRRVNLSKKITNMLTPANVRNGYPEKIFYKIIMDGISGKSTDVEKGIFLKPGMIRKLLNIKKRGLLGCNMSLFKEDLININGFDERYEAPSIGEDSDIQYRLELNGIKVKSLNNAAVQYHLYHKLQDRRQENLDIFEEVKMEKKAFTSYGILQ